MANAMAGQQFTESLIPRPGRPSFWFLVFLFALLLHVGLILALYHLTLHDVEIGGQNHVETDGQTRYRGGGLIEEGGQTTAARLPVLVSLGEAGANPGSSAADPPPLPEVLETVEALEPMPENTAALMEPDASLPDPVPDAPDAERTEETPTSLPEQTALVAAPPRPVRKPTPPVRRPEISVPEERLSVVSPQERPQSVAAERSPGAAPGSPQSELIEQQAAVPSGPPGRLGTAGGGQEGEIPRLNYKERVLAWLKMHGRYPPQAARFAQNGTVTLEFKIDRSGRILFYRIVESSGYFLLDQAVRRMMDASSPVPPMPANVPGDELHFRVPVTFDEEAPV